MSLVTKPFYDYTEYEKYLKPLKDNWEVIRDEADAAKYYPIEDSRSNTWFFVPLSPEEEDMEGLHEAVEEAKHAAPKTVKLCEAVKDVEAYSFSKVLAGGDIKPHRHSNRFVTCMLGLNVSPGSYIIADGEKQEFTEGEFVIFDYRTLHEVHNESASDRDLLLVLLPLLN